MEPKIVSQDSAGQHSRAPRSDEHLQAAVELAKIHWREEVLVEEQPSPELEPSLMLLVVARTLEDSHSQCCTLPGQPLSVVFEGWITWRWWRIWIHLMPIVVAVLVLIGIERLALRWEPSPLRAWEKPLKAVSMVVEEICGGRTL